MRYDLTEPCDACPFLKGSGFTWRSLLAHASGEFACHKQCKIEESEDEGDVYVPRGEKTNHCAGALIFLEKLNAPHQMMRICERLGLYDMRKLNMAAPVVGRPMDCRRKKAQPPDRTHGGTGVQGRA